MNPLYDLTGTNASFRTENREFMIYSPNQIVDFGTAVYVNPSTDEYRLRVFKVNSGGTVTELASGVDYNTTNFSDTNATSIAKLQDPSFNKVLIILPFFSIISICDEVLYLVPPDSNKYSSPFSFPIYIIA